MFHMDASVSVSTTLPGSMSAAGTMMRLYFSLFSPTSPGMTQYRSMSMRVTSASTGSPRKIEAIRAKPGTLSLT